MIYRFSVAVALCALCGCDAGHLGNPLTLPVRAAVNSVQNASYNARRARVSNYVAANHSDLIIEIRLGSGPHLQHASDLAGVPTSERASMISRLADDIALYQNDPDALTVVFMVHGT